jgi:hypothetical protein
MSRVLRPFLMFPRNGDPAFGSGESSEELGQVVKDFRPAAVPEVKPAAQEIVPKASASPDSPVTGSASDSPDDESKNSQQGTGQTSTPQGTSTSQSGSSETPADVVKAKLLHPSSTQTGNPEQPAQE